MVSVTSAIVVILMAADANDVILVAAKRPEDLLFPPFRTN
jgi:hypothetical protein